MTQSIGNSVRHFLSSCGEPLDLPLDKDDNAEIGRSLMLVDKAVDDFEAALGYRERALTAQQGADLVYVVVAVLEKFGLSFDEVFSEVHRSNLSRIDSATGLPYEQDSGTGHVGRGEDYFDPFESIEEITSTVR
jgi:predicted HAD superfamily Cof-like phosphohydrolase